MSGVAPSQVWVGRRPAARLGVVALLAGLAGCGAGSPSLSLVGAYFPAWILCSLTGLTVGLVVRAVLTATHLGQVVAYPLVLCLAIGTIAGLLAWLAF